MAEQKDVKVIAFVGLSGTGKSAATAYLGELGIPKVSFGDIVMNEVKKAGLEPTPENEVTIREKLRHDSAGDLVVNQAVEEIVQLIAAGQHRIVIDGLGGWEAYKQLRHELHGNLTIVALTAHRHIRHRRMAQHPEHPSTDQEVDDRDYEAIETLGKGGVIAIADHFISDNGSIEQLHTRIDELLRELDF
jgi:dephospho-CoA kinase